MLQKPRLHFPRPLCTALTMVLCAALLVLSAGEAQAKKSFFEAMFGWMYEEPDTGPDPADTLIAPFADQSTVPAGRSAAASLGLQTGDPVPLKHANTNEAEIGKWLVTAVSDAMSYEIGAETDLAKASEKYFAQSGLEQFREFLIQNNIQKVVDSGRFNIRSFAKEQPLLLNSATANDRFRWLFEVPLMVSYMDAKQFNYKENDPVNQHIILTIQVGRFADVDDPNNIFDVLIETWSGRSQRIDKK